MTTQSLIGFGTLMTAVDNHVTLSEEQIALIVARVLAALADKQRIAVDKLREAKLAELRAIEDMHDRSHSIPTRAERGMQRGGRAEYGPIHHHRGTPDDDLR